MKREKHVVSNDEIAAFNKAREEKFGTEMDLASLRMSLANLGYSANQNFITCMIRGVNPPVIHVSRGVYAFNGKPVHKDRLQKVWDEYAAYGNRGRKSKGESSDKETIAEAIKILKNAGYKVLKPITQYEEI